MELHEAVKKARKELGMSQQKLADLAGIERKQLSILENGGNVTLATIRKIVAHLPNMPPFTLGGISGAVALMPEEQQMQVAQAAAKALGTVLRTLFSPLSKGRLPGDEDAKLLDDATRELYRSLGHKDEAYEKLRDGIAAKQAAAEPAPPMTEEEKAAALAALAEQIEQMDLGEEDDELERESDPKPESDPENEPPPAA